VCIQSTPLLSMNLSPFDSILFSLGLSEDKPEFVYTVIETLLPNARFDEKTGIKLLEL